MNRARIATQVARLAFAIVFIWNMQCALQFIFDPLSYASAVGLPVESGGSYAVASLSAVQGIGVAFVMWNATYPAFIFRPRKFVTLGWVILAQQLIGLLGESYVLYCVGAQSAKLTSAIMRFIAFDGVGMVIMTISFMALILCLRNKEKITGQDC